MLRKTIDNCRLKKKKFYSKKFVKGLRKLPTFFEVLEMLRFGPIWATRQVLIERDKILHYGLQSSPVVCVHQYTFDDYVCTLRSLKLKVIGQKVIDINKPHKVLTKYF